MWISLLLAAVCLFGFLLLQWRIGVLEGDILYKTPERLLDSTWARDKLGQALDRSNEAQHLLHGRRGYYWKRDRTAIVGGVSALVALFTGLECLRRRMYAP